MVTIFWLGRRGQKKIVLTFFFWPIPVGDPWVQGASKIDVLERERGENHDNCGTLYGKAKSVYSAKKVAPPLRFQCSGFSVQVELLTIKVQRFCFFS
jgi:hypothetical protein